MAHCKTSLLNRQVAGALALDVAAHCAATGDTHGDVAAAAGYVGSTLSNYVSGAAPVPAECVVKIARVTGECRALEVMKRLVGEALEGEVCGTLGAVLAAVRDADRRASGALGVVLAALESDGVVDEGELRGCLEALDGLTAGARRLGAVVRAMAAAEGSVGARVVGRARSMAEAERRGMGRGD